ncbi:23S rRNA methyltransferase [Planctobacterium marinum]|uniref:23S rRNA methyltransferase n=2 Tax=Planctobacterium marinum TaxID=1631968 RepID=A0AA48HLR0_9ALTE|nr:23S rRNA methyltransferase [Planctobacterium marinum]
MSSMNKNFVCIGLQNPKSASNVASILRAAGCYGASSVFYTGNRYRYAKEFNADTQNMHQKIPTIGVDDLLAMAPKGAKKVVVELVEGAVPLPDYQHPQNAFYIFGPEDASVNPELVSACDDVVYIPTHGSMNLAATVNVVLYDRLAKSDFDRSIEFVQQSRDNNNRLKAF